MKRYLAITGTVTYAIKGRDALRRNGYQADIKRNITDVSGVGCGYGVSTNCHPETIEEIFSKLEIRLFKIIVDEEK